MCCYVCFVAGATFDQALAGRQAISHTEEFMFDSATVAVKSAQIITPPTLYLAVHIKCLG